MNALLVTNSKQSDYTSLYDVDSMQYICYGVGFDSQLSHFVLLLSDFKKYIEKDFTEFDFIFYIFFETDEEDEEFTEDDSFEDFINGIN